MRSSTTEIFKSKLETELIGFVITVVNFNNVASSGSDLLELFDSLIIHSLTSKSIIIIVFFGI